MELNPRKTKEYVRSALLDQHLKNAVDKATQTALQKRLDKMQYIPCWESLRWNAYGIKRDVIEHLDQYLVQFESRCRENGIQVHWAQDTAAARKIVMDIIERNKVKLIVKSKSLTTEEIHLNSFLGEAGLEVLETDLGEYIVQLLGQIPSHLTAPALHLTRQDVGSIFREKLGVEYSEDPHELLQIARRVLREKFLNADMGISGVNFAMADSGSFCVVENEANAHLAVSLPRIHLAVMGIEKIIPRLSDLATFLRMLPVSATGQKAGSYVNFIGGPTRQKSGEGPEEVHLVMLDNGRSEILADPQLRETLFCIRCGACLNVCPIYQQVGGHAYGWVYMGPIGISLLPQMLGISTGRYAPFLSSLCGACFEICPMRINIPHHLLKLRNRVVDAGYSMKWERLAMWMFGFLAAHPRWYRIFTWFPGKFQQLMPGKRAFPVPGYGKERALGRFDIKGFRNRFKEMV